MFLPPLVFCLVLLAVNMLGAGLGIRGGQLAGVDLTAAVCWAIWAGLYLLPSLRRAARRRLDQQLASGAADD